MYKHLRFFLALLLLSTGAFAQGGSERILYIIDSIPILNDPEEWNPIVGDDIADLTVIRNRDSVKLLGWADVDGIVYVFTKEYRKRPDSIKRIPTLKQLEIVGGVWTRNGAPYNGPYIDYYNSGRIQNWGFLLNGKLDSTLTVYFQSGGKKSVAHYRDGVLHGPKNDYYKNGLVMFARTYEHGKEVRNSKYYFANGQVQQELRLKNRTAYDTSVIYYSTGAVRELKLIKNSTPVRTKCDEDLAYYNTMYWQAINSGDLKKTNNLFYELWKLDSTNIDTYFKEGYLLLKEHRFDAAIAAFDRALQLEPFMRESLVHRALARLRKYQAQRLGTLSAGSGEPPLQVEDLAYIPAEELEKICRDLQQADYVDASDLYVKKMVPAAFFNQCKNTVR